MKASLVQDTKVRRSQLNKKGSCLQGRVLMLAVALAPLLAIFLPDQSRRSPFSCVHSRRLERASVPAFRVRQPRRADHHFELIPKIFSRLVRASSQPLLNIVTFLVAPSFTSYNRILYLIDVVCPHFPQTVSARFLRSCWSVV